MRKDDRANATYKRRQELISSALTRLKEMSGNIDEDSSFNNFISRIELHEKYQNDRVRKYLRYWEKILPMTPIFALMAFATSCYILGAEIHDDALKYPSLFVLIFEGIVTLLSTVITAYLPAKRYAESTHNLIDLDELIFVTIQEMKDENKFPHGDSNESQKRRSEFWTSKYKRISTIGEGMIDQVLPHNE